MCIKWKNPMTPWIGNWNLKKMRNSKKWWFNRFFSKFHETFWSARQKNQYFHHSKCNPLVLLLIGVKAGRSIRDLKFDNAADLTIKSESRFSFERASRCSAGTHNCDANAVCTFRRGEYVSLKIDEILFLKKNIFCLGL
jgi:hypothetical protein